MNGTIIIATIGNMTKHVVKKFRTTANDINGCHITGSEMVISDDTTVTTDCNTLAVMSTGTRKI